MNFELIIFRVMPQGVTRVKLSSLIFPSYAPGRNSSEIKLVNFSELRHRGVTRVKISSLFFQSYAPGRNSSELNSLIFSELHSGA